MATISVTSGLSPEFVSGDIVTPDKLNDLGTPTVSISNIVNADISASAAIAASKLDLAAAITNTQLAATAITGQTTIADPLADGDTFLVHDTSATALRKVAWSAMKPTGSITLDTAKASTSGTTVEFTGIPATAKRVTVMFSGVSTNGTDNYLVQLGDSGGFETTGYLSNSAGIAGGGTGLSTSTSGFIIRVALATGNLHGAITFTSMGSNLWAAMGAFADGTVGSITAGGSKALSDTLDRIRVTTTGGSNTFDAGTINIAYE